MVEPYSLGFVVGAGQGFGSEIGKAGAGIVTDLWEGGKYLGKGVINGIGQLIVGEDVIENSSGSGQPKKPSSDENPDGTNNFGFYVTDSEGNALDSFEGRTNAQTLSELLDYYRRNPSARPANFDFINLIRWKGLWINVPKCPDGQYFGGIAEDDKGNIGPICLFGDFYDDEYSDPVPIEDDTPDPTPPKDPTPPPIATPSGGDGYTNCLLALIKAGIPATQAQQLCAPLVGKDPSPIPIPTSPKDPTPPKDPVPPPEDPIDPIITGVGGGVTCPEGMAMVTFSDGSYYCVPKGSLELPEKPVISDNRNPSGGGSGASAFNQKPNPYLHPDADPSRGWYGNYQTQPNPYLHSGTTLNSFENQELQKLKY